MKVVAMASSVILMACGSDATERPPLPSPSPSPHDLNGDGYNDVAIATPADGGQVLVHFGGPTRDGVVDRVIRMGLVESSGALVMSLAQGGDFNGDGYADLAIGARDLFGDEGVVQLYFGGAGQTFDLDLDGEMRSRLAGFGEVVSVAGDLNGDGYAELMVSAALDDARSEEGGSVRVYFGGPGERFDPQEDATLYGAAGTHFGSSTAGVGDVNGDGHDDVVIGAMGSPLTVGAALLFLGGASFDDEADLVISGESSFDGFGWKVAGAGDLDGDGLADFAISAPFHSSAPDATGAGRVSFHFGSAEVAAIGAPRMTLTGSRRGQRLGAALAGGGDVNGDGFSDFVVAAPGNENSEQRKSEVHVLLGAPSFDVTPDATLVDGRLHFGETVALVGDFTGDGYGDVIVESQLVNEPVRGVTWAGRATVYGGAALGAIGAAPAAMFSVHGDPLLVVR